MKKQILFIVVFVLAAFANVNKSYGQCTPSATNPNAGHAYTYSMTSTAGTGAKYDWYVTKDVNLVTSASILTAGTMFTVDGSTPYHDPATGIKDLTLTWTAAAIVDGGPFYLVLRYSETTTGTAGCTIENMRVTEIKPVNSFLLAFEGGTLVTGSYVATSGSNTCAANITAAAVTAATPSLLLTYGQNTLYYVATASGINGAWYPQIQLPALPAGGTQVYASADWTATMAGTGGWNTFGAVSDGATHDLLSATAATATEAGSPILIRIVIDNVNYQTLADQGIQVGLDGYLPPSPVDVGVNKSDITSTSNCTELADFGRKATFTINKRPTPTGTPAFIAVTNP